MDKVVSKDRWSVLVSMISLNNTHLCLCVLISILNITAILAGLVLVELSCSRAASFSLGSSTLYAEFTVVGYFRWQLLPSYGRPKSFMGRLQKEVH